jgi:hypothetical protein
LSDIRRQAINDLTNAMVSMRRLLRVVSEFPRHAKENAAAHAAEGEAQRTLEVSLNECQRTRDAIETLDDF